MSRAERTRASRLKYQLLDRRTSVRPWRRLSFRLTHAAIRQAGLTDEEATLVRNRDWLGLVRYGVNFFVLEKFARVVRMSNLEVCGESFDDFLKTRRVLDAR
jgi:hypothetical protein